MTNPILKELHEIRKEILAEHGNDLAAYLHAGFERTKAAGHPIAKIKQKSIRLTKVTKSRKYELENQVSTPSDR